jgi:hypothetical protein
MMELESAGGIPSVIVGTIQENNWVIRDAMLAVRVAEILSGEGRVERVVERVGVVRKRVGKR